MAELLRAALLAGLPHGFSDRFGVDGGNVPLDAPLVQVRQVHSAEVATVERPYDAAPPAADALVTDRPGLLLSVVTADCAPVLLADPHAGVVGAAHAGWRGAHGGVIEATVAAMQALGARAERIVAAIGPCIAQQNYEVDEAFRARFAQADARFFAEGAPGHLQFDLAGYVGRRLARAGVGRCETLGLDTYADPLRFHSYRRATHRGEPGGGRQLSLIGLAPGG